VTAGQSSRTDAVAIIEALGFNGDLPYRFEVIERLKRGG
jgi:hypothetical protein